MSWSRSGRLRMASATSSRRSRRSRSQHGTACGWARGVRQMVEGVRLGAVEREVAVAGADSRIVQAHQAHWRDLSEQVAVRRERQREAARHLLLAGRSAEPVLEQARDTLDGAGLLAHAARNPIERAELVEDGAADTKSRVGREQ